jgi:hypothetical protein
LLFLSGSCLKTEVFEQREWCTAQLRITAIQGQECSPVSPGRGDVNAAYFHNPGRQSFEIAAQRL